MGDHEMPDPPAWPRLGQISCPAVLAIGELDYPMVADCAGQIADRIRNCRKVLLPGADHMLPLRVPGLLADLIDEATTSQSAHNAVPGA
jgi:3-oxoadipate enol-lactonase